MLCEMLSASFRIWTRVAVSISYDDNHYTKGTSNTYYDIKVQHVSHYATETSSRFLNGVKKIIFPKTFIPDCLLFGYHWLSKRRNFTKNGVQTRWTINVRSLDLAGKNFTEKKVSILCWLLSVCRWLYPPAGR